MADSFNEELPLLPTRRTLEDDSGDASHLIVTDGESPPTNARRSKIKLPEMNDDNERNKYTVFVAICFVLNYSIGAGVLGLPLEYYKSGYALGSILLVYLALLTLITYHYVLDGCVRAECITTLAMQYGINKETLMNKPKECQRILTQNNTSFISIQTIQEMYTINRNEYQLSELIGFFGGKWQKLTYDIFYILSGCIALWSYSSLFGVSLARNIGISFISNSCDLNDTDECRGLYSFYVAIFYIWTVVLSLMDFKEQAYVQVVATVARLLIIGLMIITSVALLYSNWYYDGDNFIWQSGSSGALGSNETSWNWTGMAYMIAVASFAFGNQYCVTDSIAPLSQSDRASPSKQRNIWMTATIVCAILYIGCGVSISIYFGSETESPCTLAWANFMGFGYSESQPVWAAVVGWFVVLFPAIDISTAFPLNANTLANTIEVAFGMCCDVNANSDQINVGLGRENSTFFERITGRDKRVGVMIRIGLCTIAAALAMVEWNFDLVLGLAGSIGLLAAFVGPCVLEYQSRKYIANITNDNSPQAWTTQFSQKWMSSRIWMILIVTTCIAASVAVLVSLGGVV